MKNKFVCHDRVSILADDLDIRRQAWRISHLTDLLDQELTVGLQVRLRRDFGRLRIGIVCVCRIHFENVQQNFFMFYFM